MQRGLLNALAPLIIVLAAGSGIAAAQPAPSPARVNELINTIKTSQNLGDRYIAAQELPNVTSQLNPTQISDATVDVISAMLDNNEIFVVHYSALALASMEKRAARAIPALRRALARIKQQRGRAESFQVNPQGAEEGVCLALQRTGAPQPPDCENGTYRY